jgi:predicted acetyltransferase
MTTVPGALRRSYQLWQSDSRAETYGAIVIASIALAPVAYRLFQVYRRR